MNETEYIRSLASQVFEAALKRYDNEQKITTIYITH